MSSTAIVVDSFVARVAEGAFTMARNNIDSTGWLLEQRDSTVVKAFAQTSVIESTFRTINMTANTVRIPRISDMSVAVIPKGSAYPEDTSSADTMTLSAVKIGGALRIAEEDVEDDQIASFLDSKKASAGSSFAKLLDNAGLGVTAAANGTTIPFTSLYSLLKTADATTGYAANANYTTGTSITTDAINLLLAQAEASDYYNDTDYEFIAHPVFKSLIRGLKDSTGRNLAFSDILAGETIDRLLGVPVKYTNGAKTSATAVINNTAVGTTAGTAGNPLLALVNTQQAIVGKRASLETAVTDPRTGLAALTDETILLVRARRAVGYTTPKAHFIFEKSAS
jgi:HK97 family phage major capsid protein